MLTRCREDYLVVSILAYDEGRLPIYGHVFKGNGLGKKGHLQVNVFGENVYVKRSGDRRVLALHLPGVDRFRYEVGERRLRAGTDGRLHLIDELPEGSTAEDNVPVLDRVLPFSEVRAAHECLEARGALGKIVLTPDA